MVSLNADIFSQSLIFEACHQPQESWV